MRRPELVKKLSALFGSKVRCLRWLTTDKTCVSTHVASNGHCTTVKVYSM